MRNPQNSYCLYCMASVKRSIISCSFSSTAWLNYTFINTLTISFTCTFLIFLQQRYQREIDKLERDNRELRKQVIILKGDSMPTPRKIKVTGNVYFKITANLQKCTNHSILWVTDYPAKYLHVIISFIIVVVRV